MTEDSSLGSVGHVSEKQQDEEDDSPCTIDELLNIITAPSGGMTMMPSAAFDEVFPNLFIGEESVVLSERNLKRLQITHVVNTAEGDSQFHVNIDDRNFENSKIKYLGIRAVDHMSFQLHPFFESAADFIHSGLNSGGKVMVNCKVGGSRSAAIVLAYLVIKHHMTIQDATRLVRSHREICPNDGFLQQLCHLNERLKKTNHFK